MIRIFFLGRDALGEIDFVVGVDREEAEICERVAVVIALAVQLEVHIGGPRQPELAQQILEDG